MRILHVITGLRKAAGTTTFVENVVREQRALGHAAEVLTNENVHQLTTNNYQLTTIFHLHGLWSPLLHKAAHFARNHNIPVVWSTHGMTAPWSLRHKWWKKMLPWYLCQLPDLKRAALIHCTTDLEADWNRALGFTNVFIAPLGTNLPCRGEEGEKVGGGRWEVEQRTESVRHSSPITHHSSLIEPCRGVEGERVSGGPDSTLHLHSTPTSSSTTVRHSSPITHHSSLIEPCRGEEGEKVGGGRWEVEQRTESVHHSSFITHHSSLIEPCRGGEGERVSGCDRRAMAEMKVEEWLAGVDDETFEAALQKLIEEKTVRGEYKFKRPDERESALEGARRFYRDFSRKIIPLSDGRYVYFAPDRRSKARNASNAISWAEYAFHAVSSSGKLLDGKNFRERIYNATKVADLPVLESVIRSEQCMYRLIDAYPENDAVIFVGHDAESGRLEVVTRLDQFGNAEANLGEVTVIAKHKKKETPPPKFRPLTEVVEAVAKHQAAGFSPSTTKNNIANPSLPRKGGVRGNNRIIECSNNRMRGEGENGERGEPCRGGEGERAGEEKVGGAIETEGRNSRSEANGLRRWREDGSDSTVQPSTSNLQPRTLLYVGRIYPVKALDNAIRAIALMKNPITLRLVGPDQAGHMAELINICKQLNLSYSTPSTPLHGSQVQFIGPKYDAKLSAEYDACDALILVSHTENFGATVVDALAHSKPVITSTKTPWSIVQGKRTNNSTVQPSTFNLQPDACGWWVDNSPESLARTFDEFASTSTSNLRLLGQNGRALVQAEYTWPAIAQNLISHYSKLTTNY